MGNGLHLLDIVFFAMVAAFLILRLRSVLGRRTGNEPPPPQMRPQRADKDNVIDMVAVRKPVSEPAADTPVGRGLAAIRASDPSFDTDGFLAGAGAAFEMIVSAYASGNSAALRPLLSDEVYRNFAGAIEARNRAGERLETRVLGVHSATVAEAGMDGTLAHVTVRFVTDQINVLTDAAGRILEGEPERPTEVTDEWTFRRNVRSPNPNWELVATRSPES
ncbi:MAG: Tim44/TimA family putative adaptor protein [Magnetospirillum sp.]|nr:Tim44/TimA family putative adaptor protein [Magnetospirillum sp.]